MKAASGTVLALDVGGTTISSAALLSDLTLRGSVHMIVSDNGAARDGVLRNIEHAVTLAKAASVDVRVCVIAFPNPL